MSSPRSLVLAVAVLLAMAPGCNFITGKDDADAVAKNLFVSLQAKDYERAIAHYSPQFFTATPEATWRRSLETVALRLGDLESYALQSWNVQKTVGTGSSGTVWRLQYHVRYRRYPATETLVLHRSATDGGIKVVGHQIASEGLRD
jgi:hypothetical protein